MLGSIHFASLYGLSMILNDLAFNHSFLAVEMNLITIDTVSNQLPEMLNAAFYCEVA